ncbi:MAG: type I DNA topoisomerase [Candidatus Saccharibacteria bacterium]|nr:type I DNA topoisomerase [Candidatus Saccharibacteria bacterium]
MAKNLVIVESPAKAKTIEKFLGKDYVVRSSFGHIRDLPKKGLNIDKDNNFAPTYEVSADKKKVVAELKKLAAGADVWLASDEDREGEAIAWHLTQALKLDPKKTKRIVFHEITKPAIEEAIKNPRTVDINLVDAQQARRILDRLVGYELSPVLWKKVRAGLSAGRVQSVSVRLIVEREREIREFTAISSFKVTAIFNVDGEELKAELDTKFKSIEEAQSFLQSCIDATFTVSAVDKKPGFRSPSAPFTTSSLQQEAARRLGYGVKQTMILAQKLYENGHITYMRTDSTTLSTIAIDAAKNYITSNFGENYSKLQQYKTKNSSAQEAHEAIRPTNFNALEAGDDGQQERLYKLIWQRTLASQMAQAKTDKTEIKISASPKFKNLFLAKGEILTFDGFLKVYGGGKDDTLLPNVISGQKLERQQILATETFSRAGARYSEASLVKKLEELGIGRPSTYAPTISTIQAREYVTKSDLEGDEREIRELVLEKSTVEQRSSTVITGADKNKLIPTHLAEVVTDFLVKYFGSVLDYDFTAKVEAGFDLVAEGKQEWPKMIGDFYKNFHPLVVESEGASRKETSQARLLGEDPKSKRPMYARFGRYGAMLQIGEVEDEVKPVFAPMPAGTAIESVTFEQALEMFKLPRTVGLTDDGQEMKANIGRFGPYVVVGKTFVSIKPLDPMTITLVEAKTLYAAKLEKDANKYIAEFASGIKIVNGPYGPFVTDGKKNAKIDKETDPKGITEAVAKEMLAAAPAKGKGRRFTKRKAKK